MTSLPQLSSIVIAMPSDAQRSARLPGLGQSAKLADLDIHHVHRAVRVPAQEGVERVDHFVEHERMVAMAADGEALIVSEAGLFDVDVHVAHRSHDPQRVVHQPARIGVGNQDIAAFQLRGHCSNAFDVDQRISANLELKPAIAFGAIAGHPTRHRLGRSCEIAR